MRILRVIVGQVAKTLLAPEECALIADDGSWGIGRERSSPMGRAKALGGTSCLPRSAGTSQNAFVQKHAQVDPHDVEEYFERRARLDALERLHAKGNLHNLIRNSIVFGQIRVLKFAIAKNYRKYTPQACILAAMHGELPILRYLRKHRFRWDILVTEMAVYHGHFALLKWAYAHDCPVDIDRTLCIAARHGNFEILKWLHSRGCLKTTAATRAAADAGHLEILRWLHEHGDPLSDFVCNSGHKHIIDWLNTIDCPCGRMLH